MKFRPHAHEIRRRSAVKVAESDPWNGYYIRADWELDWRTEDAVSHVERDINRPRRRRAGGGQVGLAIAIEISCQQLPRRRHDDRRLRGERPISFAGKKQNRIVAGISHRDAVGPQSKVVARGDKTVGPRAGHAGANAGGEVTVPGADQNLQAIVGGINDGNIEMAAGSEMPNRHAAGRAGDGDKRRGGKRAALVQIDADHRDVRCRILAGDHDIRQPVSIKIANRDPRRRPDARLERRRIKRHAQVSPWLKPVKERERLIRCANVPPALGLEHVLPPHEVSRVIGFFCALDGQSVESHHKTNDPRMHGVQTQFPRVWLKSVKIKALSGCRPGCRSALKHAQIQFGFIDVLSEKNGHLC